MIKNNQQLQIAKKKLEQLRQMATKADEIGREVLDDLASDLLGEISEYEVIKSGAARSFSISSIDELGPALIKARISRGWSQLDCAERLGVKEQMVQRDEIREYEHAKLSRVADVADALGFELVGQLRPKQQQGISGVHAFRSVPLRISPQLEAAKSLSTAVVTNIVMDPVWTGAASLFRIKKDRTTLVSDPTPMIVRDVR